MKFKLPKGYIWNIVLQESIINSVVDELNEKELRSYLKICVLCTNKTDKEIRELPDFFKVDNVDELYEMFATLEKKKLIKISSSGISLISVNADNPVVKRFKSNLDNSFQMMNENDVTSIIRTAEKSFGKMLSVAEINSLTNLNSWYGLDNEIILLLIEYVASLGKRSISYLEKTALEWSENEINTPQKAHEYIREAEERRTTYGKIKTLLKIYNRDLTKKEREFVDKWHGKHTDQEISDAYEKTIDSTGKISFAYMDKVLNSDGTSVPKARVAKKKNKFTNFEQRNDTYKSLEDKMFEKMIKEAGKKG